MKYIIMIGVMLAMYAGAVGADEPDQKFQGFNLQGYDDDGEKTWNVNGDTADIVGNDIILSNVDANMFGKEKMNLTARTGVVDQVSGKIHLEEDVIITSESGKQMMTDTLDWDRATDLVTTEDDVIILDERMMTTGTGMRARPGMKTAKIKKDVTVMIDTDPKKKEENKTVTITCSGPMVIDQEKSVATFQDNVVAVQEDQILETDRMEVYFSKKMDGIEKMICIGNVRISQGENKSFAERAVYSAKTQKMTLTGRPKLILLTEGGDLFAASGN